MAAHRWSAMASQSPPRCGSSIPTRGPNARQGQVGEIWLHGDHVCLGYWQKPEQTEQTFNGRIVGPSGADPDEAVAAHR